MSFLIFAIMVYQYATYYVRITGYIIFWVALLSCNNERPTQQQQPSKRKVDPYNSLVEDRIAKTLKTIDSLEDKKDVYAKRNLQMKVRELLQETDQLMQYFNRCENRIIAASGGKNTAELKNPGDTVTVSKIMILGKQGDTLQTYMAEMHDIFLKLVKDSANVGNLLPDEFISANENGHITGTWKAKQFKNLSVLAAIELFDKYKYDANSCELVILDRILRDAERRK